MQEYDFKTLKHKSNKAPLPEDINEQIETLAEKMGDTEGLAALKENRTRKWFGEVYLWDTKGRLIATAFFDHGICFRYNITSYRKDDIHPLGVLSVKNKKLNDRKGSPNEQQAQGRQ